MDKIPEEILAKILGHLAEDSADGKNFLLAARLTCKAFGANLSRIVFGTVVLDFERVTSLVQRRSRAKDASLATVCDRSNSLLVDMSVVHDREEYQSVSKAFEALYEYTKLAKPLMEEMNSHVMSKLKTFEEKDFSKVLAHTINSMSELKKMKLLLPLQLSELKSETALKLFCITMKHLKEGLENRDQGHFTTLVVQNITDIIIVEVFKNPVDLHNTLAVFEKLKHLVLTFSIDRGMYPFPNQIQAQLVANLWRLIWEGKRLQSLCFTGMNTLRRADRIQENKNILDADEFELWECNQLPYHPWDMANEFTVTDKFQSLRFLELRRVNVRAPLLKQMLLDSARTLRELYLNEVYLKCDNQGRSIPRELWIGLEAEGHTYHPDVETWLAKDLSNMKKMGLLKLNVLRATGLGYDYINVDETSLYYNNFDINSRNANDDSDRLSFDLNFIRAVMEYDEELVLCKIAEEIDPTTYDVVATQKYYNTTSIYMSKFDGLFNTNNRTALNWCDEMSKVAVKGISTNEEFQRQLNAEDFFAESAEDPAKKRLQTWLKTCFEDDESDLAPAKRIKKPTIFGR